MKAYPLLTRLLSVDSADPCTTLGLARVVASGVVVLAVGVWIVGSAYVRNSFRWPCELEGW